MIYAPTRPVNVLLPDCQQPMTPMVARAGLGLFGLIVLFSLLAVLIGALTASCGKPIAFLSMREGNWEIYAMDPRVAIVHNLTHSETDDYFPAWSRDGTRLAFRSARDGNEDIYVMSSDGRRLWRLTNHLGRDLDPAWSPDGTRIAFVSYRIGAGEIFLMDSLCGVSPESCGANLRQITQNSSEDLEPDWSPDGTQIIFSTYRNGNSEIYVMDVSCVRWLEDCERSALRLTHHPAQDRFPAWSPDGRQIAFVSNRTGNDEIFLMDEQGNNVRQLTFTVSSDWHPTWSEDGREILFQSYRDGNAEVYVMNADGAHLRRVTHTRTSEWYPIWWP
jgi:Tol biopolymer transport system component